MRKKWSKQKYVCDYIYKKQILLFPYVYLTKLHKNLPKLFKFFFINFSKTNYCQVLILFRINTIIRNVSVAYTKNYMTADDIIEGDGPIKWSFSSSVFFSWTAITTIGK